MCPSRNVPPWANFICFWMAGTDAWIEDVDYGGGCSKLLPPVNQSVPPGAAVDAGVVAMEPV